MERRNRSLRSGTRDRIDNTILGVLGLVACLLIARPIASVLGEHRLALGSQLAHSFWIVSAKLLALFAWIAFAILFLVRIATDLMQEMAKQSITDALSGVLNRRGFFEQATPVTNRASTALPAAVLICDIDRFKSINDTYGHGAGDRVIQGLARVLSHSVGGSGIVGRLGGEEFAVVFPKTDARAALLFADGVRTAFSNERHEGIPTSRHITVSIGLADSSGGEDLDSVLDRADTALYRAKRKGRDRVECALRADMHPRSRKAA